MDDDAENRSRTLVLHSKVRTAGMLSDTERGQGVQVARGVAEGMLRAAADWVFDHVGPMTAYNMLVTISDEYALRIHDRREAKRAAGQSGARP